MDLVDLDRYPLHDPGLAAYAALLEPASRSWKRGGSCLLPGFLRRERLDELAAQCDRLASLGHRRPPSRGRAQGGVVVGYDLFPLTSPLRALYEWDGLSRLVAGITGQPSVFRSADPLGALELSVMTAGDEQDWEPERAEVLAVLMIRPAERGGTGEWQLPGGSAPVEQALEPGSLFLVPGPGTRSRVGRVAGSAARHELRLAFATTPGTTFGDLVALERHGRLAGPGRRG